MSVASRAFLVALAFFASFMRFDVAHAAIDADQAFRAAHQFVLEKFGYGHRYVYTTELGERFVAKFFNASGCELNVVVSKDSGSVDELASSTRFVCGRVLPAKQASL